MISSLSLSSALRSLAFAKPYSAFLCSSIFIFKSRIFCIPYWGNYTSKSLPVTVDKSYVQATIEGCHHNTFMYRVKGTDGKFQDTNDSSVDVKIEHRSDFKGYPEGWRNE